MNEVDSHSGASSRSGGDLYPSSDGLRSGVRPDPATRTDTPLRHDSPLHHGIAPTGGRSWMVMLLVFIVGALLLTVIL